MKIKLTNEQIQRMDISWRAMDDLKKDKQFMKLMAHCCDKDFDDMKEVNSTNEDDYMRIINFYDDLKDRANEFNFFNHF
jgi:hypothetical protein